MFKKEEYNHHASVNFSLNSDVFLGGRTQHPVTANVLILAVLSSIQH